VSAAVVDGCSVAGWQAISVVVSRKAVAAVIRMAAA
jgi:hypothetical protein